MSQFQIEQARAYCKELALTHYENFTVGSFLLPKKLRQHIYNVYAYCRFSDDLADESGSSGKALRKLNEWEEQLVACFTGDYQHEIFLALSETIDTFNIPIDPFQNLLVAFKQDQKITRYDSFDHLLTYCQNSANPVGRIYLYLFGLASPERFHYSDLICTALQLTNFWQDITIDLQKGRIYIPLEDFARFKCHEDDLKASSANKAVRKLIQFQVDRTQQMFDEGRELLNLVSKRPQKEVAFFIQGGESILQKIRDQNFDVLKNRPMLKKNEKFKIILKTLLKRKFIDNQSDHIETKQEVELVK